MKLKRRAFGFTLVELMITVTVAAIFLAIAIPSFTSFVAGQRVKTAAYDLVAAITLVRSEAVKRAAAVSLTQSPGGWHNGWTIVSAGVVLSSQAALPGLQITGAASPVTYGVDGRPTAAAEFSISSTADSSVASRCVSIELSGIPSSNPGGC